MPDGVNVNPAVLGKAPGIPKAEPVKDADVDHNLLSNGIEKLNLRLWLQMWYGKAW